MLKRSTALLALAALPLLAQPVVQGMGKSPAEYVAKWGRSSHTGDGPFETKEQVWTVTRKSGLGGQDFKVHVLFRDDKSVEERWVRPGDKNWEKEELWAVLDGKGPRFELLRQGTPLVSPYQVLQAPNTLINFAPQKGEMAAQLQNTLQGPQLRITSREWAQAKQDMGLTGQQGTGRLMSSAAVNKIRPAWGGKSLSGLTANLREQAPKANVRTWATRNTRGTLTIATKKNTRLELTIGDAQASVEVNRILNSSDPSSSDLKDALRETFRKFYAIANQAVPNLIGGSEWDPERTDGIFEDDILQDLIAMKRMPSEFALLAWKDNGGEAWDLALLPTGYRLTISWPAGMEPK